MPMEFDNVQIFKFIDFDTDDEFEYYSFYDSGDDYTTPPHFMEKLTTDKSYEELSNKLEQLRGIIWNEK